jgi:hypothetical protein
MKDIKSPKYLGGNRNLKIRFNSDFFFKSTTVDSHDKILGRSDYHTLQNLSSNTIEKKEPEMSRIANPFEISFI